MFFPLCKRLFSIMYKNWMRISLLNFAIAASMGAVLRFAFVREISWLNFRHFLHGHSHLAMLGWIFQALFILLLYNFLPREKQTTRRYKAIFWLSQTSVMGMLFTFPFMGYAPWSIFFSTCHILVSYAFTYRFWKDLPATSPSVTFVKTALVFMLLSTVALWAMGPVIAMGMKGSALYYATVQFYLHFQFNGWFTFAVIGLFLKYLEDQKIALPAVQLRWFYRLLVLSSLLTYALVIAWSTPLKLIFWTNSLGVLLQLGAGLILIKLLWPLRQTLKAQLPFWSRTLLLISAACFLLKILMQSAIAIPAMATIGFTIHNYVIGFIHLILLGVITLFILGMSTFQQLIHLHKPVSRWGLGLLLLGFLGSEFILYLQGTLLWSRLGFFPYYYEILFAVSALMPIGVILLVLSQGIGAHIMETTNKGD